MTRPTVLILSIAALALGACSAPHDVCKDEASTRIYTDAFMADTIAAAASAKLPPDKMKAVEAELSTAFGNMPANDFAGRCRALDRIRTSYDIPALP